MRHINLNAVLTDVFNGAEGKKVKARLERAHKKATADLVARQTAYVRKNGPNKWKPVKERATNAVGKKCWYTEVELIGAPLVVDHYRPVCDYWWLAYDAENYRIACPWANSPEHNAEHGCAGGKGESFPLLPPGQRAADKNSLHTESPVILDPCSAADCDLLAFQADGRPVLNPAYRGNAAAEHRVQKSMIFLNLDHAEFNSQREQLCRAIAEDVESHEALDQQSPQRAKIRARLKAMLLPTAPFSTAARFYLQLHRHLDWVQALLDAA
jgi:hypothetical protein